MALGGHSRLSGCCSCSLYLYCSSYILYQFDCSLTHVYFVAGKRLAAILFWSEATWAHPPLGRQLQKKKTQKSDLGSLVLLPYIQSLFLFCVQPFLSVSSAHSITGSSFCFWTVASTYFFGLRFEFWQQVNPFTDGLTVDELAKMDFIIKFAQIHETFRVPEIEALAIVEGIDLRIIDYNEKVRETKSTPMKAAARLTTHSLHYAWCSYLQWKLRENLLSDLSWPSLSTSSGAEEKPTRSYTSQLNIHPAANGQHTKNHRSGLISTHTKALDPKQRG